MSNTRNTWNDDNSKLIDELNQYKKTLTAALKTQAELKQRLQRESNNQLNERKLHAKEKDDLVREMGALTAYAQQLELNNIDAHEQIKNLTHALQQSNEQIKDLTTTLQQTKESLVATVESKALDTKTENTNTLVVTEPTSEAAKPPTAATEEAAGPSSYGIFSPWRLLGYKNQEATPQNPAHLILADLTKASLEQANAENALPGMSK